MVGGGVGKWVEVVEGGRVAQKNQSAFSQYTV